MQLKSLLAQLQGRVDLVVIAGPPLPTFSDALVLGAEFHDVLLVVTRGKTARDAVQQALDTLRIAHAEVLGTAYFTRRRGSSPMRSQHPVGPPTAGQTTSKEALERTRSA